MKHVVAKVDKWHFSKNEFFKDFNLFTKTNFPEKKIALIFNQFSVINSVGAIPTLGGIGEPTPVPGELRSLPTHCRTKAQRFKCADSPQTENIKHRFIKVRPWCSITTTNTNLKINGPNTRDLNSVAT